MTTPPTTLDDIQSAAAQLRGALHRTPVFTSQTLDGRTGRTLFFKAENLQRCGSFKARGALHAVLQLTQAQARLGVVTDSSGNHGQALAWAAATQGIQATIVMPSDAPLVKQEAVRGYGAQVVLSPPTMEGRAETLAAMRLATGATYVPPSQHTDIMAGQGTVALELLDQVADLDALVVPVGGGGLLSGITICGRSLRPDLRIFAAEPTGANDAAQSKAAGKHLAPNHHNTIAGGLLVGLGALAWPVLRDQVEAVIQVDEDEIVAAMRLVWERMKLVVEPSGAVSVAAVLAGLPPDVERVGVVLSGGNVDLGALPW